MRVLLLLCLFAAPLGAQAYISAPGITPIPNNAPGIRNDIVVTGGPASIQSMRVRFTIHHPNDNDLGIWLVPPGVAVTPPYTAATMAASTAVPLSYNNGGTGDDYLDSQFTGTDPCFYTTSSIWSASAPFDKLYGAGQLSNFYNTNANGTWGLVVYDQASSSHAGVLVSWSLEFAGNGLNVFQRPLLHQPWTIRTGQPNAVLRLDFAAPSAQTLQNLTVSRLGAGPDSDISAVSLWHDLNHDGFVDTISEPQLGGTVTLTGGDAVFSGLGFNINQGWSSVIVMVDGATSGGGNEFGARLASVGTLPGPLITTLPLDGPVVRIADYASTFPADENFDGQISPAVSAVDLRSTPAPSSPDVDTAPTMATIHTPGRVRALPNTYGSNSPDSAPNHVALDRGIGALDFRYDLSAYDPANHAFGFQFRWASTGASPSDETGVFASDDGGTTWFACMYRFPLNQGSSSGYVIRTVDLSAALVHAGKTAFTSEMVVRIQHSATDSVYTRGLLIDSVSMRLATRSVRVSAGSTTTVVNGSDGINELNFGNWDVNAGASPALTVTVKNVGSTAVSVGTPSATGSVFLLNTTGYIGTLAAGASTTFTVAFDPSSINSFSSVISITHGAPDATNSPFSFTVRGTGVAAPPFEVRELTVSGTPVAYGATASGARAFGQVAVGSASSITTLHIVNVSSQTITFGNPVLGGNDPGQFVLDDTGFVNSLGPSGTTSFTVQFQPTLPNFRQAQVSFTHSATVAGAPPTPWVCGVSGFGTTPPTIALVAGGSQTVTNGAAAFGQTDFGDQLVHAGPTLAQNITITNSGTQVLNLGTPALVGTDPGEFSLDLGAFAATVAGGTTTAFHIRFDPTSSGAKTATVTFTHDATNTTTPFTFDIAGNGTISPVIEVREAGPTGAVMTDGTAAVGPFAFGQRELTAGPSSGGVCYIENLGSDDLVLGTPTLSGAGAADFIIDTTGYQTTVTPGNATSFQVQFDPNTTGLRVATVNFTHNDPQTTNPSFSFQVTGTGFSGAWISVHQDNVAGAVVPSGTGGAWQDFGTQDIAAGPTATKTIWIQNNGSANLTLGALTLDEFPGAALVLNTTGFQSTIAPGNGSSFAVQFDPSLVANHSCFIRFTHNSGGGQPSPYAIQFLGEGTTSQAHPVLEVRQDSTTGSIIQNGSGPFAGRDFGMWGVGGPATTPLEVHVLNTGTAAMTANMPTLGGAHPGDFLLDLANFNSSVPAGQSTSFTVSFQPTVTGVRDAVVSFDHDGLNTSTPFSFDVTGEGAAVAILEVRETSVSGPMIPDGSSTATGGRDFGFIDINAGPSAPLVIVIRNVGSVNMNVGNPNFLSGGSQFGLNNAGFQNSVAPGTSTTFEIYFDPTSTGAHTALVRFTHDALPPGQSGVTTFSFVVGGYGTNGPIAIPEFREGSTTGPLIQHASTPSSFRDFGSFDINSGPTAYKTFFILNTGTAPLNLGTPTLPSASGYNQSAFVIDASGMASTVQPTQSTSFSVAFDPNQVGQLTGLVRITHSGGIALASPFEFEVTGTGTGTPNQPNIQLYEINIGGPPVPNGGIATGTNRDFGVLVAGSGPGAPLTLVVKNWGSADLVVGLPNLGGANSADFNLNNGSYATVLTPGATTSFTVSFNPLTTGAKTAAVSISHNAGILTPSPFTFEIIGTAVLAGAQLEVRETGPSGAVILNGDLATGTSRDFGQQLPGAGPGTSLTIYVQNTGSTVMTLGTPTLIGADASEFALDMTSFSSTVAIGTSTSFTASFNPASNGSKQAQVAFTHDAINTATPFVFEVVGQGASGGGGGGGGGDDDESCSSSEHSGGSFIVGMLLVLASVLWARVLTRARRIS